MYSMGDWRRQCDGYYLKISWSNGIDSNNNLFYFSISKEEEQVIKENQNSLIKMIHSWLYYKIKIKKIFPLYQFELLMA